MVDELETVIETRARSVDLAVNNYYEFLYSFHISKENYRKGSIICFQLALMHFLRRLYVVKFEVKSNLKYLAPPRLVRNWLLVGTRSSQDLLELPTSFWFCQLFAFKVLSS